MNQNIGNGLRQALKPIASSSEWWSIKKRWEIE